MTEEITENNNSESPAASPAAAPSNSLLSESAPVLDFTGGKPEAFPDDFWDANKGAPDINKLFLNYQQEKRRAEGLRVKLSKGEFEGTAPKDAAEYVLELEDTLKAIAPDNDPLVTKAKEVALAAGLPKEAFKKFMEPMIAEVAKMREEMIQPPSEEEIAAQRSEEIAKLGSNGRVVVQAVNTFIDSLVAGGKFSEHEANTLRDMATTADALRVLNKFRMMTNGSSVPVDLPITDTSSRDEIAAKMAKAAMSGDEINYNKYAKQLHSMQ